MAELELKKLVLHFAQSNKAEGKSPKTISWYTEMLTDFTRFLASIGRKLVLAKFDISVVREFVIHEQERELSPYTVQGKVRALKAFASWLFNEGYTTNHFLYNLKMPKAPQNLIEPLTATEIDQLLKSQNPLTAWGKKAGVSRLHAHLCRHTYATNFLNHKCGDVFRLQQILGHTTLEMVRRYVHYASAQAMINGRPSSPMDHMGIRRLNGYKIDRMLKNNHKRSGKDSYPEYNDRGRIRRNDR